MEFDAATYNRINRSHFEDTKQTLRNVLTNGFGTVATIVDIGCGSGNITRVVADTISHERILALDVDPDMIKFAQENNALDSAEFIVQDISVPFNKLDPKLKALEGKVDLVWSNRVLHWVPEEVRPQAAQNILRLLKPGGKAFINTTFIPDFTLAIPPEEKVKVDQVMKVPSKDEQRKGWADNFRQAGAAAVSVEFEQKSFDLGAEDMQHCKQFVHYNRRYLPDTMTLEEKDKFLEPYGDAYHASFAGPVGSPLPLDQLATYTFYHYGLFHIVVSK